jgi:hypothetical protein
MRSRKRQEAETLRMVEFAEWQTALNNTRMRQAVLQEVIEELKGEKPDAEKLRKAKAVIADFTKEVDENLVMIKSESANCQWQEPQWRKDQKELQELGEILYPWKSAAEKAECLEYLEKNSPENKMIEILERIEGYLHTLDTQPQKIPSFVLSIVGYYPQFIDHYPKLETAEYIRATDTGLQWLKSKQSLAEYFSAIKPKDKSNNWKILENIFGMKDLRNAASQNGNVFKGKKSKDFEGLQEIITRL